MAPTPKCRCPDVYVLGFPCTPWSTRHYQSQGWEDPATQPWHAGLDTIRNMRPAICILENVHGLLRTLDKVLESLHGIGGYYIAHFINEGPQKFGYPLSRPRVYLVMVRTDAATVKSDEALQSALLSNLKFIQEACSGRKAWRPVSHIAFRSQSKSFYAPLHVNPCFFGCANNAPASCLSTR